MYIKIKIDDSIYTYTGDNAYNYAIDFCIHCGVTAPEVTVLDGSEYKLKGLVVSLDTSTFRMKLRKTKIEYDIGIL